MAIRFACAQCGKIHRVPDQFAGKRGRCGRCGLRFVAPGSIPGSASVFVPADADEDLFNIHPGPRRKDTGDRSRGAILFGLLAGCLMVCLLFLFRDGIVSNAPALAPLMPPKAELAPIVRAAKPNVAVSFDVDLAGRVGTMLLALAHLLLLFVLPLTLPAVLSLCRVLSVGRWLIMAGLSAFFAATAAFLFFAATGIAIVLAQRPAGPQVGAMLGAVGLYVLVPSFFGIAGCLLAAAIHPKHLPSPGASRERWATIPPKGVGSPDTLPSRRQGYALSAYASRNRPSPRVPL